MAFFLKNRKIACRNCGERFAAKWDLMSHRKNMHANIIAVCRNNLQGKCDYTDEMCWWNHSSRNLNSDQISCYVCGKVFANKIEMMKHRKTEHIEIVRPCTKFLNNECRFQEMSCWYTHGVNDEETTANNSGPEVIEDDDMEVDSVFQNVTENLVPPLPANMRRKQTSEKI